jgi:hypothetical protein
VVPDYLVLGTHALIMYILNCASRFVLTSKIQHSASTDPTTHLVPPLHKAHGSPRFFFAAGAKLFRGNRLSYAISNFRYLGSESGIEKTKDNRATQTGVFDPDIRLANRSFIRLYKPVRGYAS